MVRSSVVGHARYVTCVARIFPTHEMRVQRIRCDTNGGLPLSSSTRPWAPEIREQSDDVTFQALAHDGPLTSIISHHSPRSPVSFTVAYCSSRGPHAKRRQFEASIP